jgi:hypothetical protein
MKMNISNAEKQARFRKKEELKKFAERVFRESSVTMHSRYSPQEILQILTKATDLPAAWTDEDYALAVRSIQQFRLDLFSTPDQIAVDVFDARDVLAKFSSNANTGNLGAEWKEASKNAHALSSHLLSACDLSACTDAEEAAALMEVVRVIGRKLANNQKVPRSQATAMCLLALGQHYERPDWFAEKLAEILHQNLGQELGNDVAHRLTELGAFP